MAGSSDFENRSCRRSRVRATYPVSLGFNPRAFAHPWKQPIAVEIFPKLAITTRSK
jgi:hypothetical protein